MPPLVPFCSYSCMSSRVLSSGFSYSDLFCLMASVSGNRRKCAYGCVWSVSQKYPVLCWATWELFERLVSRQCCVSEILNLTFYCITLFLCWFLSHWFHLHQCTVGKIQVHVTVYVYTKLLHCFDNGMIQKNLNAFQDNSLHYRICVKDKGTYLCAWWRINSCIRLYEGQVFALKRPFSA